MDSATATAPKLVPQMAMLLLGWPFRALLKATPPKLKAKFPRIRAGTARIGMIPTTTPMMPQTRAATAIPLVGAVCATTTGAGAGLPWYRMVDEHRLGSCDPLLEKRAAEMISRLSTLVLLVAFVVAALTIRVPAPADAPVPATVAV